MKKPKTIFKIYEYEVQEFAEERIGRQLSDEELSIAKKCLESGLLFDIGTVYKASIDTAVEVWK